MCNATTLAAQAILDALSNRIKNGSVFTAFDITTDARDGTDEKIRHRNVRDIVSNEFATSLFPAGYNKEAIELNVPGNPWAVVYYPDGKIAQDHSKAAQSSSAAIPALGPIPSRVVAAKTAAPKPSFTNQGGKTKDGDSFICKVTCDGRINVPKDLYSQISVHAGTFDVQFNSSILYKKPIGAKARLVLKKSELKGGTTFKVSVDVPANTIIVEQI